MTQEPVTCLTISKRETGSKQPVALTVQSCTVTADIGRPFSLHLCGASKDVHISFKVEDVFVYWNCVAIVLSDYTLRQIIACYTKKFKVIEPHRNGMTVT